MNGEPALGRAASNALTALGEHWAVRLTTFRRDGTPVSTPVNVAVDGNRVYFRTYEQAGKFKRLRNNPRVEVAPSTWRGEPTGPAMPAEARLLTGEDDARAARLIDAKHKVFQRGLVRTAHRLRRYTTRHLELLPRKVVSRTAFLGNDTAGDADVDGFLHFCDIAAARVDVDAIRRPYRRGELGWRPRSLSTHRRP